jgi:UDP-galactopyranose mutase
MPREGYTSIIANLLNHPNITLHLNTHFSRDQKENFDHVFYSGALDAYFDYELGRLEYRTLDFEMHRDEDDFQGCAVMNYGDLEVPYTRISEHKHFAPWETHEKTLYFKEHSRLCKKDDIPYYPIRISGEQKLLKQYVEKASQENNITFVGRLGTYRYLDMDVTIKEALEMAKQFLESQAQNTPVAPFSADPLK